jgi:hypothetical protein
MKTFHIRLEFTTRKESANSIHHYRSEVKCLGSYYIIANNLKWPYSVSVKFGATVKWKVERFGENISSQPSFTSFGILLRPLDHPLIPKLLNVYSLCVLNLFSAFICLIEN